MIGAVVDLVRPAARTVYVRKGRNVSELSAGGADVASRLDMGFSPGVIGPNGLADRHLLSFRNKARWLAFQSPYIRGARERYASKVVGKMGINPRPNTGNRDLDRAIEDYWYEFAAAVDVDRKLSLVDVQLRNVREIFTVGEVCAHRVIAPAWRGYAKGPAIQEIDTDRIEIHDVGVLSYVAREGTTTRQGVIRDSMGRTLGYRVLSEHPADGSVTGRNGLRLANSYITLSAERADLVFATDRPEQLRGIPPMATVVIDHRHLMAYRETEVTRARIQASVAFWMKGVGNAPMTASGEDGQLVDWVGNPIDSLEAGMTMRIPRDSEIGCTSAAVPGPAYSMVVEDLLRSCAAGLNVSYETLAADYSKSNFSSSRASNIEERRGVEDMQEFLWRRIYQRVYQDLIRWGVAQGRITVPADVSPAALMRHNIIAAGSAYVNPSQEATASAVQLSSRTTTLADECGAKGRHWEDVISQTIAEEVAWNKARKEAGLEPAPLHTGGGASGAAGGVAGTTAGSRNTEKKKGDKPQDDEDED